MNHPLQARVAATSRQANRLLWQYGLLRFLAAAVTLVAAIAVLDFLLRWHDSGLRWMASLISLLGIVLAFYFLARPVFANRRSLIDIAQRIERRFPQLGERLSSSMAFLGQGEDDPTAGSPALRRSVVAEAEALSAGLDFGQSLDARPSRRAALATGIVVAAAASLALFNPAAAELALTRLAMPWREQPWPRGNELAFVNPPARLAAGDDFEVELLDRRGTLPDVVRIELQHRGPLGSRTETHEMKRLGQRMVFRLGNVGHPFNFRASGGDDDTMGWHELLIVEPPKVVELNIEIQPPEYTGLPKREEGRVVKALTGSQLRILGRLDKPIAKAAARSETPEFRLPAVAIAPDGLSFTAGLASTVPSNTAPWNIERSGTFWFDLTDEHGLLFGRDTRVELHAVSDSAPALAWETPLDHSVATPRAIVPIKALVKDDLAIRGIQLRFLRPGASEQEQVLELYAGPMTAAALGRGPMGEGDSRSVDYGWDLARLSGLNPGDVLAVRLTAEDYKPQLATTVVRRLTIVTEEELENRVTQRQGQVLNQLAEALRSQRQCREQVSTIESRLSDAQALEGGDLNHLQSAQLNQRQVEKLLGAEGDGVESQIVAALAELEVNRVGSQAAATRLNELLTKVRELNRGPLPLIEQELTQAFKSAGAPAETAKIEAALAVVQRLQAAGQRQDDVIASLEGMLGALAEWDSFSRLAREIGQIRTDQTVLAEETEAQRVKMVAAADAPAPADRDASRKLSQRQLELARRLDKIQSRMEEILMRLEASDPLTAGTLADALDAARRLAIGGRMREAAAQLAEVRLGPAHQTEQAAIEGLKQLLELLSSRRDHELARSLASLREANSLLTDLIARGRQLQAEMAAAADEPDAEKKSRELQRLTKELEELAAKIEQLGRQLQRLRATQPAASLGQAAGKGRAASQAASDGNAEEAQAQSRDTQRLLEEAQGQLAEAVAEAEQQLAQEQLARIEQAIAGIVARQKNVIAETQRLDALQQAAPLDAPQQAALRNVAAEERMLADEANQLRPRLDSTPAFAFALEGIIQRLQQAAGGLLRGQTDQAVQQAEQAALARLEQMLAALKPDESEGGEDMPPPDQQENPPMTQPPRGDLAGAMAELKLLKLLQEEINRRTMELEDARAKTGQLSPADEEELAALAREQGRLADMVYNLIEATAPRPEDNPDALPDVQPPDKLPPAEPKLEDPE